MTSKQNLWYHLYQHFHQLAQAPVDGIRPPLPPPVELKGTVGWSSPPYLDLQMLVQVAEVRSDPRTPVDWTSPPVGLVSFRASRRVGAQCLLNLRHCACTQPYSSTFTGTAHSQPDKSWSDPL